MFWIMITIIGIVLSIVSCFVRKMDVFIPIGFAVGLISLVLFVITGMDGVTDYRYLKTRLVQLETLQDRLPDIRGSVYAYEKGGNFVAGSVENMNQSTNLSAYITTLAKKEGYYKSYLEKCKINKETFVLKWFGSGWATSKKIYTLPTTFKYKKPEILHKEPYNG